MHVKVVKKSMSSYYGKTNWLGCKIDSAMFSEIEIFFEIFYRTA